MPLCGDGFISCRSIRIGLRFRDSFAVGSRNRLQIFSPMQYLLTVTTVLPTQDLDNVAERAGGQSERSRVLEGVLVGSPRRKVIACCSVNCTSPHAAPYSLPKTADPKVLRSVSPFFHRVLTRPITGVPCWFLN